MSDQIPSKHSNMPSTTHLKVSGGLSELDPLKNHVLILGPKPLLSSLPYSQVRCKLQPRVSEEVYGLAVESLRPSSSDLLPLFLNRAFLACLPKACSRHNTPSQSHALTKLVRTFATGSDDCIVVVCEYKNVFASACAVARAFPIFNKKSKHTGNSHTICVEFLVRTAEGAPGTLSGEDVECIRAAVDGVRLAARIVDTPCSEMHTDAFLQEISKVGDALAIKPEVIRGQDLADRGFGGIYSVGQAAEHPPALAVLSHRPRDAEETIAWVGKGIVYDTGGLCIKSKSSMAGMKRDCGGAAAVLGAFYAAVKMGFQENLHAIFCLAENAVGPKAIRPDDIITMYSGRTVEINNTDAEGRLVLGDGVSYAEHDLKAGTILDMGTLTGAQGTSTGRFHAAVLTNSEDWESLAVKAGRACGDLVHSLPYTPEIHFCEFGSVFADMKNSVSDRGNAQSSCAGLFIGAQIGFDYEGDWIHVDIASPSHSGDRATGYGVALLTTLFGHLSENPMLRALSPQVEAGENGIQSANKKIRLE